MGNQKKIYQKTELTDTQDILVFATGGDKKSGLNGESVKGRNKQSRMNMWKQGVFFSVNLNFYYYYDFYH